MNIDLLNEENMSLFKIKKNISKFFSKLANKETDETLIIQYLNQLIKANEEIIDSLNRINNIPLKEELKLEKFFK